MQQRSKQPFLGCQGQQNGLAGVLKEGSSVLRLSLLHPVSVGPEGAGIDQLADGLQGVRVPHHQLPGDRLDQPVLVVNTDRCQDGQADHLQHRGNRLEFMASSTMGPDWPQHIPRSCYPCREVGRETGSWHRYLLPCEQYGLFPSVPLRSELQVSPKCVT